MISEKSNNKKNTISLAIAGMILMIIVFVLLYFFVFSQSNGESVESGAGADIEISKKIQIKNLDIEIFQDQRYLKLKDAKTRLPEISELNPGKENIFTAD